MKDFLTNLKNNNWKIEVTDEDFTLPDSITERYNIPQEWFDFIKKIKICTNDKQNKWFITADDYNTEYTPNSWNWNEFELMSLEAAEGDDEWQEEITAFWDTHFPIFIDIEGDYSYYAIDTESGEVVEGYEPDFEDCLTAAESFDDFLSKILDGEIIL